MADMIWERLLEALQDKGNTPNTFTRYLGEQLKKAREEARLSQSELAKQVYRRRPTISDIENAKVMPDIGTVVLIAVALNKPLTYFVAPIYTRGIDRASSMTDLEQELLVNFRQLTEAEQSLAIKQVRTLLDHVNE